MCVCNKVVLRAAVLVLSSPFQLTTCTAVPSIYNPTSTFKPPVLASIFICLYQDYLKPSGRIRAARALNASFSSSSCRVNVIFCNSGQPTWRGPGQVTYSFKPRVHVIIHLHLIPSRSYLSRSSGQSARIQNRRRRENLTVPRPRPGEPPSGKQDVKPSPPKNERPSTSSGVAVASAANWRSLSIDRPLVEDDPALSIGPGPVDF